MPEDPIAENADFAATPVFSLIPAYAPARVAVQASAEKIVGLERARKK